MENKPEAESAVNGTRVAFERPEVVAWMSDRRGGHSLAPWAGLNLGTHVGDDAASVAANRRLVQVRVGMPVLYLEQVHGTQVHRAGLADLGLAPPRADAAWTDMPGLALSAQVADCLPVLLARRAGPGRPVVAAAHAGWRGLCEGVLETLVRALDEEAGVPPSQLQAWLGPCIGPLRFEVGPEVRDAFVARAPEAVADFVAVAGTDRLRADLRALARRRLTSLGVGVIAASEDCTVSDTGRYFSYRRDGQTGRMAAIIGLQDRPGSA